jgi:hypothetical protein
MPILAINSVIMQKSFVLLLLPLIFIIGCKKDEPPTGIYIGSFSGLYTYNNISYAKYRSHKMIVTESNEHQLIFESGGKLSIVSKIREVISGTISTDKYVGTGHNETDGEIVIRGSWSRIEGRYVISGDFESTYSFLDSEDSTQHTVPVIGTFEIKSEF